MDQTVFLTAWEFFVLARSPVRAVSSLLSMWTQCRLAIHEDAVMLNGGLLPFDSYLERAKRARQPPVVWSWRHILSSIDQHADTERGTVALTRPGKEDGTTVAPGISAALQVVAEGARTSAHAHSFWHLYFVRGGQGSFEDGTEAGSRPIRAGDIIYVPPWCDHVFSNTGGDGPLILLALQNLPAMADLGNLARRDAGGTPRLVFSEPD